MTVDALTNEQVQRSPSPDTTSPSTARQAWTVMSLVRAHRQEFVRGSVLLVISSGLAAAMAQLTRATTNAIVDHQSERGMILAAAMMLSAVVAAVARIGSRVYIFNAGRNIEYYLRADILKSVHTLGPAFFRKMGPGEVMSRATNDLAQVRLLVGFAALNVVNALIAYLVNIPLMLSRSVPLTFAALAPFPIFILLTRTFAKPLFSRSKAIQESIGALSERAQQALAGMRVVRAYQLEAAEVATFTKLSNQSLEANLALARLRGSLWPILGTAGAIASLIVLWYGGSLVAAHKATLGDLLAFQAHLALVAWPTVALGYIVTILARGRASLERINEILCAKPDVADNETETLAKIDGGVRVENLSYSIETRKIIDNITFSLRPGGSLAIVGKTGSGKSVLAQLLARMLPTPEKTVFLDGVDVTKLALPVLRGGVCLAQQEAFLFSSTIARNIAFATDDPDAKQNVERSLAAAKEVQLEEEVSTMSEGFNTIVGERGVQLSGGQKQRVSLARALLADPKVLILDDPLSAVDARTESLILDAIDRAAKNRTLILVTHRIAAAARCERVIVLEHGHIAEDGTPHDLLHANGLYARLAQRQHLEAELEAMGE